MSIRYNRFHIKMIGEKFCSWILLWNTAAAVLSFAASAPSAVSDAQTTLSNNSRKGNARDLMLVMPVVQGSDPTDPRLHFWFTKAPVTIIVDDGLIKKTTPSPPKRPSNHKYEVENNSTTIQISSITDRPSTRPMDYKPIHVTSAPRPNDSPMITTGGNLEPTSNGVLVISAESKWKTELHKQQENEKLNKVNKPTGEKSTILPSSTRFHYYTDFMPIASASQQPAFFPPSSQNRIRFPTTDNPLRMYEMMKKLPLKPLPMPNPNNMDVISSEQRYLDVLNNFAAIMPSNSIMKEESRTFEPLDITLPKTTASSTASQSVTVPVETSFTLPNPVMTTTPSMDSIGNDKLTDDFKLMLIALGILTDNKTTTTEAPTTELWRDPDSFTTDPLSYSNFKRIPENEEIQPLRQDMQSLLDSFGLLPNSNSSRQSNSSTTLNRVRRLARSQQLFRLDKKSNETKDFHELFQEAKISQQVSANATSTTEIILVSKPPQNQVNENETQVTPQVIQSGQQSLGFAFSERPSSSQSTTQTSPKAMTTPEEVSLLKRANNGTAGTASIEQLATSFGEGETTTDDPADDDPTPRPNGLYFFVDWNTFLNVSATGKEKPISLKFSPRVGNPRLFLPIDIP